MNSKEWNRKNSKAKKKKRNVGIVFIIYILLTFMILFTYSSLNLKNIDYGYKMQELVLKEKILREEIDKLNATKSNLLNLSRVERIVIKKLGYIHPKPEQFIKVFEE